MKFKNLSLKELELGATLGTGSFGRVRLCQHGSDKEFYALKMLKKTEIIYLKQVSRPAPPTARRRGSRGSAPAPRSPPGPS